MKYLVITIVFFFSFQVNAQEKIIYCDVWGAKTINTSDEIYKKRKVEDKILEFSKKIKIVSMYSQCTFSIFGTP